MNECVNDMKKMILTCVVATMISASAVAQDQVNQQEKKFDKTEMIQHRTNRMVKEYGLNSDQAEKLLKLNTKYADKMPMGHRGGRGKGPGKQAGDGQRPPRMDASKRSEMKATREAYQTELKSIMTTEQYTQYEQKEKNRRPDGHRGGHGQGEPSNDGTNGNS